MIDPMRVVYLVSAVLDQGISDGRARDGWTQIAHTRFVTPERNDVRVVCRAADLIPLAGRTPMLRGSDYEDGPPPAHGMGAVEAWIKQKDEIDRFVAEGNGEWVEL